ncbi:LysE family translocator [Streptomyces collinus]|uniref:LysE family translocator n=1 Tax=Streptomyces collinus TaxID=42684 RepID=UPI0033EF9C66
MLGIQTGTLVWGALTSLGVTALVTASHVVYEILRCAGAAYLLWMATRMIDDTFRVRPTDAATTAAVTGVDTLAAGWRQGTLTNLINPKTGVFYIAVLPQFIPAGAPHFSTGQLLTAVHIAVGVLWCGVLIVSVSAPGTWLRRARVRRVLDRVTDTLRVPCGTVSSGPAPPSPGRNAPPADHLASRPPRGPAPGTLSAARPAGGWSGPTSPPALPSGRGYGGCRR